MKLSIITRSLPEFSFVHFGYGRTYIRNVYNHITSRRLQSVAIILLRLRIKKQVDHRSDFVK